MPLEDIIDEDAPLETQVKILNWMKRTYLQHLPIHETQDMVPFTNIAALINKQLQLMLSMSIKSVTKEVVVATEEKTNASSSLSHRHGFFTSSSAKTTYSVSDNHLKLI